MFADNMVHQREVEQLMMELNRSVILDCPQLDVPWFHASYCENHTISRGRPTSIFNLLTPKGISRTGRVHVHFGAGGSVSMYLQHCEPNSGYKNVDEKVNVLCVMNVMKMC